MTLPVPGPIPIALEVRGARVSFGGVQALDGVDLVVGSGERVGVIGPNGAGKTTLFDAVCGYLPLDSGTVAINGSGVDRLDAPGRARAGLARSFSDARLFPSMTVAESLLVAATRRRGGLGLLAAMAGLPVVKRSERRAREVVERLLGDLALGGYRDAFVGELSTGTRRVVDLAAMLAREPRLVLLDEPSAGLAQAEVEQLAPLLGQLAERTGAAVVVIEHDIPLVAEFAERLVVLESGRVLADGVPADVLADAAVVEAYLGTDERSVSRSGRSRAGEPQP